MLSIFIYTGYDGMTNELTESDSSFIIGYLKELRDNMGDIDEGQLIHLI